MQRAPRITRARALALPRPQPVEGGEWYVAAIAVALLLAGLVL